MSIFGDMSLSSLGARAKVASGVGPELMYYSRSPTIASQKNLMARGAAQWFTNSFRCTKKPSAIALP